MDITAHAILLILFPIVTVVAIAKLDRRIPTKSGFVWALLFSAAAMSVAINFTHHLCDAGQPFFQWLIPSPCIFAILLLVRSAVIRRTIAFLFFFAMLGLSFHFTEVVHEPGWTGNPSRDLSKLALWMLQADCKNLIAHSDIGRSSFGPGWMCDLPLWKEIVAVGQDRHPRRPVICPAWHSWFTGLYPVSGVEQDFWYPGGPFSENLSRIELRDRTRPRS